MPGPTTLLLMSFMPATYALQSKSLLVRSMPLAVKPNLSGVDKSSRILASMVCAVLRPQVLFAVFMASHSFQEKIVGAGDEPEAAPDGPAETTGACATGPCATKATGETTRGSAGSESRRTGAEGWGMFDATATGTIPIGATGRQPTNRCQPTAWAKGTGIRHAWGKRAETAPGGASPEGGQRRLAECNCCVLRACWASDACNSSINTR